MKRRASLSTRVVDKGGGQLQIDDAKLVVTSGPDKGLSLPFYGSSLLIGTDPRCELVLRDETVSAKHAEISATSAGYSIRDLRSKNGVTVNDVPVQRAYLFDRARIRLGNCALTVHSLGTQTTIPLVPASRLGSLVANSVHMRAVAATVTRLADADATVLIEGETGSGKEVVAHALHATGSRRAGPFVVVDCAALGSQLVGSALFGHERGAFTGADETRRGLLAGAEGGTLFIDEVGELPLDMQPLLLRAVEKRVFRPIGGRQTTIGNVRIVAATHRNLAHECRVGRFREDLFYRLAVTRIRVPPLRHRVEDIPILADTFASELGAALAPDALRALSGYEWPGNVRELRNVVQRIVLQLDDVAAQPLAEGEHPMRDGDRLRPLVEARRLATAAFEREYLQAALAQSGGIVSRAAKAAGVSRQALTQLVRKHSLRVKDRT